MAAYSLRAAGNFAASAARYNSETCVQADYNYSTREEVEYVVEHSRVRTDSIHSPASESKSDSTAFAIGIAIAPPLY